MTAFGEGGGAEGSGRPQDERQTRAARMTGALLLNMDDEWAILSCMELYFHPAGWI
jgi:hypothetical protein